MNLSAASPASLAPKRSTCVRWIPASASNSSFSRRRVNRAGAASGVKNSRGWGSNVRTLQVARLFDQPLQHRAMAAMHAVEIADGEPHGPGSQRNDPVRDLHERV
jgi:hypothetical protein